MYNTDIPTRAELPTSKQLLRSTGIAVVAAAVILTTIVLPSEYAIDPTGVGGALGLTEMGEIKNQLTAEPAADAAAQSSPAAPTQTAPDQRSSLLGKLIAEFFVGSAAAQTAPAIKSDATTIVLKPTEGAEVKLDMKKGAKANFAWSVEGGVVNFDTHGEGGGQTTSYGKGRSVPGQQGVIEAAFDGKHGWFWRNRGKADVTVTLKVDGDYAIMTRVN